MVSIINDFVVPIVIISLFLLVMLGLIYLLYRFFIRPLIVRAELSGFKRRYKKQQLRDSHIAWCKEKTDKKWKYLEARKWAFLYFDKAEIPQVLYTFYMIQKMEKKKK